MVMDSVVRGRSLARAKKRKISVRSKTKFISSNRSPFGRSVSYTGLRSNVLTVARPVNGFPLQMRTTLKYMDTVTPTPSAGATSYLFRVGSIYDPDFTGTGHQPMGHDNLALIYLNYQTLSSWIKVTPSIAGTSALIYRIGIVRTGSSSVSTVPSTLIENGPVDCVWKALPAQYQRNQSVFMRTDNIAEYLGLSADDSALVQGMASNPSYDLYYQVWFSADTDGATATGINLMVEMSFDVILSNPKNNQTQN